MSGARCRLIEAIPIWRGKSPRITSWRLSCPTCGLDIIGRHLADVLDTEHAHNLNNVKQDRRSVTTPAWLTDVGAHLTRAISQEDNA